MVVGPSALLTQPLPKSILTPRFHTGESGLGKSTLINTLFNTPLYPKKDVPQPHHDRPQTVAIESITAGTLSLLFSGPVVVPEVLPKD